MNQTAVIYQSKYGSTKCYAEWIAEELGADLLPRKNVSASTLAQYETVIYGGGLHAGGIAGISLLKKNLPLMREKRCAVFAVGASHPTEGIVNEIKAHNAFLGDIPIFYLRGGMDYHTMNPSDKLLMSMFKKVLEKKQEAELDEWEIFLLDHFYDTFDFTDRKTICPLIEFLAL